MRIKHYYCLKNKKRLVKFLDRFQVPYEISNFPEIGFERCCFNLYEDQDVYTKFKWQFFGISRFDSIKSVEYSKEEIESAEWFTIRSIGTKVQWEYEENTFQKTCSYRRPLIKELYYRHSKQIDILSVRKPVNWGTRQYFSGPNAADDLIFCSEKAKELLQDKWLGLEFWPVKKCNDSKYISDLYQLVFVETLPIEAIAGGKSVICNICGKRLLRFTDGIHQLEIKKDYLKNMDIVYKTGDVLTEEFKGYTTFSINIVSKEFYLFCEKNQMNRGMIYEPIRLV